MFGKIATLFLAAPALAVGYEACWRSICGDHGTTRWWAPWSCKCNSGWTGPCCDEEIFQRAQVWKSEGFEEYGTRGIVDYAWPEQQLATWPGLTANVGVCISGGGSRSYAAGFGQLRALYDLGTNASTNVALNRVRYLEGTSGGAWLASVYTYHQTGVTDAELLGLSPNPEHLTLHRLAEMPPSSLGYGASRDMFAPLLGNVFWSKVEALTGVDPGDVWTNAFSAAVLSGYGLDHDKFFTYDEASRQAILDANPTKFTQDDFILPAPGPARPYLILPTTSIGPNLPGSLEGKAPLLDPTKKAFANIEATPLYTGYPLARDITVSYADGSTRTKMVGGLIASHAFGAAPPTTPLQFPFPDGPAASTTASLTEPARPWSIKQAAGASSIWGDRDLYFLEQPTDPSLRQCHAEVTWHPSTWGGLLTNFLSGFYCSVTTGDSTVDLLTDALDFPLVGPSVSEWAVEEGIPQENRVRLADSDVEGDPLGLFNVLVRNVDHLIGFLNVASPLCDSSAWDPAADTSFETLNQCIGNYLPPLFGIPVGPPKWAQPERSVERLQVFRTEDFAPFVQQLQRNLEAGNTAVARMLLTTVENTAAGVPAGHSLDWCLFYLSSSPAFEKSLPQETQDELSKGVDGKFAGFPYYSTLLQNPILDFSDFSEYLQSGRQTALVQSGLTSLTIEQINLLSGLTSWAVRTNVELFRSMFD